MKKIISLTVCLLLLGACSNKVDEKEKEFVENFFNDKVMVTENGKVIMNELKNKLQDEFESGKIHEIYEELMKYEIAIIKDNNGNEN